LQNGGWDRGREATAVTDADGTVQTAEWIPRFWSAYDALDDVAALKAALPTAQLLHRAILRTGTSVIEKRQIRTLNRFRFTIIKDGPDVKLFTHPSALTKLTLWLGEALAELDISKRGRLGSRGRGTPFVCACLNEERGVYVIVGSGGGGGVGMGSWDKEAAKKRQAQKEKKEAERAAKRRIKEQIKEQKRAARRAAREARGEDPSDDEEETESEASSSDDEDEDDEEKEEERGRGFGRNKFGTAFQEVIYETNAAVRVDSFEHCVVEVEKDSLMVFLEALSMKSLQG
jgi:cell division control protein 45